MVQTKLLTLLGLSKPTVERVQGHLLHRRSIDSDEGNNKFVLQWSVILHNFMQLNVVCSCQQSVCRSTQFRK